MKSRFIALAAGLIGFVLAWTLKPTPDPITPGQAFSTETPTETPLRTAALPQTVTITPFGNSQTPPSSAVAPANESDSGQILSRFEEEAARLVAMPTGQEKAQAIQRLAAQWAATDPLAAWEFVENNLNLPLMSGPYLQIMQAWSQKSPAEAFVFAVQLEDPTGQMASMAYSALIQQDLAAAGEVLDQINNPNLRSRLSTSYAGRLAAQNSASAMAWVQRQPAGQQARLVEAVVVAVASDDVKKAAALTQSLPAEQVPAAYLAEEWSRQSPADGARWAASLPPGPARNSAFEHLVRSWAQYDANEPAQWLLSLPSDPARDAALESLASQVESYDPEGAKLLRSRITPSAE